MSSEKIKAEKELLFAQIKRAEERLAEIRAICKHENVVAGNYSYRIGAIFSALICSDCGECIKAI